MEHSVGSWRKRPQQTSSVPIFQAPFGSKEAFISLDVSVTRDLMVPVETVSVWAVVLHNKRKHMVGESMRGSTETKIPCSSLFH